MKTLTNAAIKGVWVLAAMVIVMAGTVDRAVSESLQLEKTWTAAGGLRVPESVLYDENNEILYVSNINGKPVLKNSKGFISKLSVSGEILELQWATGLNAPKGAAIFGNSFYVSDIDELVEINVGSGEIVKRYKAEGASFLNDVAVDALGNVYVSDYASKTSAIYCLSGGKLDVWLKNSEISRPNGLYMDGDRLLVGNCGDGTIKAVTLTDKKITVVATVGGSIDGLRPDGQGNYYISDWKGKTSLVTPPDQVVIIMDTSAEKINAADLEYIVGRKLLLIPTFNDNRVLAYTVR
jgi:sugar lactone lactonase YvrE